MSITKCNIFINKLSMLNDSTSLKLMTLNLSFKRLEALAVIDPKKFFIKSFPFFKILTNLNLEKVETGVGMFTGAS